MLVCEQVLFDLFKPVQEDVDGPLVAAAKLAHHALEQAFDFLLRKRHDAGDDPLFAIVMSRLERANHDAAVVGLQDDPGAVDLDRAAATGESSTPI